MNKNLAGLVVLAAVLLASIAITFWQAMAPRPDAQLEAGPAELPRAGPIDFSLPDIDGVVRRLSDWDGKARIVNFWATWCAPCRREIPLLKRAQVEHAANNLQVIGVAVDFVDPVRAYAAETDFNYPVLVGQEDAMAAVETSGLRFVGLPVTMIVAPDGELLATHIGEILEAHIDLIMSVFARLEAGDVDLEGARKALEAL